MLVGSGLRVPEAWPQLHLVALAYVLHYGLTKGALFLGVGVMVGAYRGGSFGFWPGSALLYQLAP